MQYSVSTRKKDKGYQYIISYKNSDGKWKQKSKQGFKGSREAKLAADKALEELKLNIEFNPPSIYEEITFKEFSKQYLEHSKNYREVKTVSSTETVLNNFSDLNELEMSKITNLDIQKIVDKLTKNGLNPNTIRYYIKKLTAIFNNAKNQYNIIKAIPTRNLKINKPKEVTKRALNDDEVVNLLNDFKDSRYYMIIYLAVKTGMRLGEILGLTWDEINLKEGIINVNKQWKLLRNGEYGFGELKSNNSKRIIPIPQSVCKELSHYSKIKTIDNRVCSFENKSTICACLDRILKVKNYDISIHELRHTYATKLIANGLDFKTVSQILGHDIKETIKTYSHVNNDMMKKAKNLIENIF